MDLQSQLQELKDHFSNLIPVESLIIIDKQANELKNSFKYENALVA